MEKSYSASDDQTIAKTRRRIEENDNNSTTDGLKPKNELAEISTFICELLKQRQPQNITDVPTSLHPMPPFINKDDWTILGNVIKITERPTSS